MYAGELVEYGEKQQIFENPRHPYTKLLISSIPSTNPEEKKEVEDGNANKISNDSKCDCPFAPRCEKFSECCMEYQHRYIEVEPNHFVMCCNKHL